MANTALALVAKGESMKIGQEASAPVSINATISTSNSCVRSTANEVISKAPRAGRADHSTAGQILLGDLAQQWGMEVEDVRGILFEGLDPDEVRGRITRERRARRIGEITEDPGEGS